MDVVEVLPRRLRRPFPRALSALETRSTSDAGSGRWPWRRASPPQGNVATFMPRESETPVSISPRSRSHVNSSSSSDDGEVSTFRKQKLPINAHAQVGRRIIETDAETLAEKWKWTRDKDNCVCVCPKLGKCTKYEACTTNDNLWRKYWWRWMSQVMGPTYKDAEMW